MARDSTGAPPESVISIIGPGMKVIGDCHTDGTVRVEGTVEGSVHAGKAVVIGKQGVVRGNVVTQDAVISGRVEGTLVAESRLELQATCQIEGEIVKMGEKARRGPATEALGGAAPGARPAGEGDRSRQPAVAAPRKA
jgi:cytoskeletal protein CcmA (bactofilin family)